jgi:SAM-dependent MidA family methyltransferase
MTIERVKGVRQVEALNTVTPLTAIIRDAIFVSEHRGTTERGQELSAIPFHQYMTYCLYHPEFGYYRSGASRVGREGDFYTSAYIGDLMGGQLAAELRRLAGVWFKDSKAIEVIDWGGGTGRLGRQMLEEWQRIREQGDTSIEGSGDFSLTVVEGNAEHRRLACEELAEYIVAGKARVVSSEEGECLSLDEQPVIIIANELLDAFPVYRLVMREGIVWEIGVGWEETDGSFIPCLMKPVNPHLLEWLEKEKISLLPNQTIEVNLDAAEWLTKLASRLRNALIVLIDYGDETEELTAAHRMDGTLLCYYKHQAHNDPYRVPGEQDITAHVNFSYIRQSALHSGLREIEYGTQKKFLIESGILNKLSEHTITDPFHPIVRRNRAIRQLLLSDGMSELFKVQIFLKLDE